MTQFPVPEGTFKSESHWYERTLRAEHVSAILDGIDPSRVLSRDFFIPQVPNQFGGGRWTSADVYDFALTQKPGVTIPRLYPAPAPQADSSSLRPWKSTLGGRKSSTSGTPPMTADTSRSPTLSATAAAPRRQKPAAG
jgi:hypothetical protein